MGTSGQLPMLYEASTNKIAAAHRSPAAAWSLSLALVDGTILLPEHYRLPDSYS